MTSNLTPDQTEQLLADFARLPEGCPGLLGRHRMTLKAYHVLGPRNTVNHAIDHALATIDKVMEWVEVTEGFSLVGMSWCIDHSAWFWLVRGPEVYSGRCDTITEAKLAILHAIADIVGGEA